MSISLIQRPQGLTPAYNQNVWVFNSTEVNKDGFRYVVKVYDDNGDLVSNQSIAPEPNKGYGYVDLSKILSSQVSWDLDVNDNIISASNSIFNYTVNVSEEYLYSWPFYDTTFVSGGKTRIQGSTTPLFGTNSTNNSINVVVDNEDTILYEYTFVDGYHSVIDLDTNAVIIDVPFQTTPLNPGDVYFSDRRRESFIGPTYSDNYVFNGRKDFKEFIDWDEDVYSIPQSPT